MHVDTKSTPAAGGDASHGYDAPDLRVFVFALFFIFGGITSLNDIIIPKMKELFTLDHATAMLVSRPSSSPMRCSRSPPPRSSGKPATCGPRRSAS